MKQLIKKGMILFMWYPLRITISFLPLPVVALIGRAGGKVLRMISREKQRVMTEEFGRVLPGRSAADLRGIVRESFVNYGLSELEVLLYPSMDRQFIDRVFAIEGKEHLDAALARGKGVLLFQAHFGAFQMTMPAIGYSGYTMNQISASAAVWKEEGASAPQKRMVDIKAKYEYTLPVKHISITSSLRPVFHALKRNEIVGITVDGGGGKKTMPLRFLGRESVFQTGAVDLAISTGAAIVPAFVTTEPGLHHRLVLHEQLPIDEGMGKNENRRAVLQAFASLLESYVLRYPHHYGYTLCLRRQRAHIDPYPFFTDYGETRGPHSTNSHEKVTDYA
jgi:lauroyl/myristoyl acyltransferase